MTYTNQQIAKQIASLLNKNKTPIFQKGTTSSTGINKEITVRMSNGKVVRALGWNVSTPGEVNVFWDAQNKRYVAWKEETSSLKRKTILANRKTRPDDKKYLWEYFIKVLQPSSIEGFDADVALELLDCIPIGIVNTGDDYYTTSLTFDGDAYKYLFTTKSLSNIVTVTSNDFLVDYIPFFRLIDSNKIRTYEIYPTTNVTTSDTSSYLLYPLSYFRKFEPKYERNFSNTIYAQLNGTATTEKAYKYGDLVVLNETVTIGYNKDLLIEDMNVYAYGTQPFDYNFSYQDVGIGFIGYRYHHEPAYYDVDGEWRLYDYSCNISRQIDGESFYIVYTMDKNGLQEQRITTLITATNTITKDWSAGSGTTGSRSWSDSYSSTEIINSFVADYAHSNHDTRMNLSASGSMSSGMTVAGSYSDTLTSSEVSSYDSGSTFPILIREDCSLYLYVESNNNNTYDFNYTSGTSGGSKSKVEVINFNVPQLTKLCIKTSNPYVISDFTTADNHEDRVFIRLNNRTLTEGSFSISYPQVILGLSGEIIPGKIQKKITRTRDYVTYDASSPGGYPTVETIEYFASNSPNINSLMYKIYSFDGNGGTTFGDVTITGYEIGETGDYTSMSFNVTNVTPMTEFFMWSNYYRIPTERKTLIIPTTNHTTSLVFFLATLGLTNQSNLYTILDENGNETVELAIAEIPTTTTPETLRADIYRFNTSSLKWERRPNAITSVSLLTDISSFISYHPTPSNSRKKRNRPPRS